MKTLFSMLPKLLPVLLMLLHVSLANANESALLEEARSITQQTAATLKRTLQTSIMTSGPASAIQTCRVHAPGITEQTAQLTGWQVRRTSNKIRNPNNRPDLWEIQVLNTFEDKAKRGAPIKNLEHSEIVNINGQRVFRYMKAIETKGVCLNCHGPHVSGPIKSTLKQLFPTDKATGYREGDLRGAFTLQKPL